MAEITTYKVAKKNRPLAQNGSPTYFRKQFSLAAGNQNDTVTVVDIPQYYVVRNGVVNVSATLGTGCTLTLARGATALSSATTAAQASRVAQNVTDTPSTSSTEDVLNVTIGGAAVGATAVVTVECDLAPLPYAGSF